MVKFDRVLQSEYSDHWLAAVQKEVNSIVIERQVFVPEFFDSVSKRHMKGAESEDYPSLKRNPVVGLDWRIRVKKDNLGNWESDKARLIALGYTQVKGVNYFETFYNAINMVAFRMLCAIACAYGFMLFQADVSTAFLYAPMLEVVYTDLMRSILIYLHWRRSLMSV